ncbi:hypothetical protein [Streptomyces sp. NPDC045369]|uniref:hypothetical protein n=1 Tax=Streptomyces sp. NPDC045369 TaxID=3155732 RepID=UPI0033D73C0C
MAPGPVAAALRQRRRPYRPRLHRDGPRPHRARPRPNRDRPRPQRVRTRRARPWLQRARPRRFRLRLASGLLLCTATLLPLLHGTASAATAAGTAAHAVLRSGDASGHSPAPDTGRSTPAPAPTRSPSRHHHPHTDSHHTNPHHSNPHSNPHSTPHPAPDPLTELEQANPLSPLLPVPLGPLLGSGPGPAHPALPSEPHPSTPNAAPSAAAGATDGRVSRPPSPAATSQRPGAASPAPAATRRGDLAGRLARRPYVPLPPLQAPAPTATAARTHGPSRYAPGAVPGAASAASRAPYADSGTGSGVHRVLPLGAGMALTGLGLGFIALRLRRS